MALDEPRDRCVIGPLLRRQDAERDILFARPLDLPRRARPTRERVKQQRDHHRRVIGRPAAAVSPVGGIEPVEVHLANSIKDEPREVTFRQPLPHIRRHQKRLITITRDEALSHHQMVLNPSDGTRLTRQPQAEATVS